MAVAPDVGHELTTTGSSGVRRYPAGRVCAHDGCTTRLSRYNPSKYCALHAAEHAEPAQKRPQRHIPKARNKHEFACVRCGHIFPLTEEYFPRSASRTSGFHPECHGCHRERRYDRETPRSKCPSCGRSRQRTTKFFPRDRRTSDGLSRVCRSCHERDGRRICPQCLEAKPLTTRYWAPRPGTKLGFAKTCKRCEAERLKRHMIRVNSPKGSLRVVMRGD